MAFGGEGTPCGLAKLKVLEWLESLIAFQFVPIAEQLAKLQCPQVLLQQVQRHDMNSLYQHKISHVFEMALSSSVELYVETVISMRNA